MAAGDVASCRSRGDEATAALVARIPGTVAVLGDAAYERGTPQEFRRCYAPSWGRFRARTRAALGNHEYLTRQGSGAIRYFGLPRRGYYGYDLGAWHVVVLNTNCLPAGGCDARSPQARWLRADLARSSAACTLAYGHHPRWSSGLHGSDRTIEPLWRVLAEGGVDVALAGHDHHYERFARIDGIRSFVVGTGGATTYPTLWPRRGSKVIRWAHGVLKLTLHDGWYAWEFVPVAGERFADAGVGVCS